MPFCCLLLFQAAFPVLVQFAAQAVASPLAGPFTTAVRTAMGCLGYRRGGKALMEKLNNRCSCVLWLIMRGAWPPLTNTSSLFLFFVFWFWWRFVWNPGNHCHAVAFRGTSWFGCDQNYVVDQKGLIQQCVEPDLHSLIQAVYFCSLCFGSDEDSSETLVITTMQWRFVGRHGSAATRIMWLIRRAWYNNAWSLASTH